MNNVTIYSTANCVYCNMAKSFLKSNGVDYTEYDVAANLDKRKEMIEKTGQMGVPVMEVNGEIIVGFDEAKIKELIKK